MRDLGQLESVVMEQMWSSPRALTVRDVLVTIQRKRTIAYTTVMTVMANLHRKGLLQREMNGAAYQYWAAQTREQHNADLMRQILGASSNRAATLLHFIEQMPPAEVAKLRDALQQEAPRPAPRRRR